MHAFLSVVSIYVGPMLSMLSYDFESYCLLCERNVLRVHIMLKCCVLMIRLHFEKCLKLSLKLEAAPSSANVEVFLIHAIPFNSYMWAVGMGQTWRMDSNSTNLWRYSNGVPGNCCPPYHQVGEGRYPENAPDESDGKEFLGCKIRGGLLVETSLNATNWTLYRVHVHFYG